MDEMKKFATWFAAGNPIWQFGFAFCSTLVIGGAGMLAWMNGPEVLDWAHLAWEVARGWVGTIGR